MAITYGSVERQLKPAKLPLKTLTEIGRLVRACAEIEDIIDLHIATLAEISESKATILLGRTAVTRRLEIAKHLAMTREGAALAAHNHAFDANFAEILKCRNAVSHGKLLGSTPDGFAFLTADTAAPTGTAAIRIVIVFTALAIRQYAMMAEGAIPALEKHLKVQASREARLLRPLSPRRKARPQQAANRSHPPQS